MKPTEMYEYLHKYQVGEDGTIRLDGPFKGQKSFVPYFAELANRGIGFSLEDKGTNTTYHKIPVHGPDELLFPVLKSYHAVIMKHTGDDRWLEITETDWCTQLIFLLRPT